MNKLIALVFGVVIIAPYFVKAITLHPCRTPEYSGYLKDHSENINSNLLQKPLKLVLLDDYKPIQTNNGPFYYHSNLRKKRGIIWNKIKKVKNGIYSAKKKIWKIKSTAYRIIAGPDNNTPKPKYVSTGGSWGWIQPQQKSNSKYSNNYKGNAPLLSSSYGPPYGTHGSASNSNGYGTSHPISYNNNNNNNGNTNNNWNNNNQNLRFSRSDYESLVNHLVTQYGPPIDKEKNYKGLAVRFKI